MEGTVLIALLALYFLPAVVAAARGHHNGGAIFMLNLLLGWTFLGWVLALVWSLSNVPPAPAPTQTAPPNPRQTRTSFRAVRR